MFGSTPGEFASHRQLTLAGTGLWYRLDIPFSLMEKAEHSDLRDLRIVDADGDFMPFLLLKLQAEQSVEEMQVCLRSRERFWDIPVHQNQLDL
ncbi:MAG: DUF3999 domain-containing protein [Candidatus Thiodiazotropha sp. (ex Lucinoma aequizonata)]|nr:DUF3999 domain-containing protein [Candidatus Thiodiazotropha sp. (ex Lucinoma aequizonata)]MCU7887060.1 DUF3999 domain-containing protein [Candidatus Thiodiazotropha sp. (ex Lucinoma aequizonata)]MCU7894085.1 DUF3999 domain-containing protein [Candidatus Thiodiazotropha sp. (ex Lucinoma aequizonata)]MCU7898756.1 DUF3999 domain-containing protein [Candidatus Thiodiazotropha sp. (ex Lucinoma aequizonata)]MCU7900807.1 DUF3999 domain-containing protein [Candidatus Thiodiazotropha sp. (ex Lucino